MNGRPTVSYWHLWTREISFGGDQNCRVVDGKRGHWSGTLGDVPALLMVIQCEEAPALRSPCDF
jgi:hypothetical protein